MLELAQKIVDTVQANSGSMLWSEFVDTLDHRERALFPNALKQAMSNGLVKRRLEVVDGKSALYLEVV